MTATSHALIGTIIASQFPNPYLAIPLALLSHVAADMVPHWDTAFKGQEKDKKRIFIETLGDITLGLTLSYSIIVFLFPETNLFYAFTLIIFAQLPDWLFAPYYFFKIKAFKWAYDFGKITNRDLDKPWGVITQIVVVVGIIALARIF